MKKGFSPALLSIVMAVALVILGYIYAAGNM